MDEWIRIKQNNRKPENKKKEKWKKRKYGRMD